MTAQPAFHKKCLICGKDISTEKGTGGSQSGYYCAVCWDTRRAFAKVSNQPFPTGPRAWREGEYLVIPEAATLPARCVVCNCDTVGDKPLEYTFGRPDRRRIVAGVPGLIILFGGMVIELILDAAGQGIPPGGPVRATLFVCKAHRRERRLFVAIPLVLLFFSLILAIAAVAMDMRVGGHNSTGALVLMNAGFYGVALFGLAAKICHVWPQRWAKVYKFDGSTVYLEGISPAFLDALPETTA